MAKEQAAAKPAEDDKEPAAAEGGEGEAVAEGDSAPVKLPLWKRKKKLILIGAAALIAVLGGGVGLYVSGIFSPHKTEDAASEAPAARRADKDHKPVFYDLGDMMVNLSGEGKRPNFLKIKVSLELGDEADKAKMEQIKPRILDDFQTYLRELRIDDLKGSAGIYRLREELLLRVGEAAHPTRVDDVLITEMLVQ